MKKLCTKQKLLYFYFKKDWKMNLTLLMNHYFLHHLINFLFFSVNSVYKPFLKKGSFILVINHLNAMSQLKYLIQSTLCSQKTKTMLHIFSIKTKSDADVQFLYSAKKD